MSRVFITGSSDGLGLLAARQLHALGHTPVLHARNEERRRTILNAWPEAPEILIGDLSLKDEIIALADQVNAFGTMDAVIHNAGVYNADGQTLFMVNVMAPYLLSALIQGPQRLVYLSSGMHLQGHVDIVQLNSGTNRITYSDSKLMVLMLSKAIAGYDKAIFSNAVNPGWVPTKMGGRWAPDDLQKGFETQVWLSVSNDPEALVSGRYFFHRKQSPYNPEADNVILQDKLMKHLEMLSGVRLK